MPAMIRTGDATVLPLAGEQIVTERFTVLSAHSATTFATKASSSAPRCSWNAPGVAGISATKTHKAGEIGICAPVKRHAWRVEAAPEIAGINQLSRGTELCKEDTATLAHFRAPADPALVEKHFE